MDTPFGSLSPCRRGVNEFGLYDAEVLIEKVKIRGPPVVKLHKKGTHGYEAGSLGLIDKIYSRDGRVLTATDFPKREPWFGNFMRV